MQVNQLPNSKLAYHRRDVGKFLICHVGEFRVTVLYLVRLGPIEDVSGVSLLHPDRGRLHSRGSLSQSGVSHAPAR